jgi:hypothetical protein
MAGEQPAIVAERYGIDAAKVRVWKQRYVTASVTESVTASATPNSRAVTIRPAIEAQQLAIGDLVMENLRAKLLATQGIAEYVRTPIWIDKQTAADMAELFEVLDRAATNILDRMAAAGRADDESDGRDA